jgi:hypothetical protein
MNTTTNTTKTNTKTNEDDDDENFLLKSRKEMLDYFLSPECDFTRELVERAASMMAANAAAATTTTTSTRTTVQLHAPPPRSKRDRFMSAFKGQIKPLQSHRLLDERERILALSQMPLKWNRRKKLKKNEKTKTNLVITIRIIVTARRRKKETK